jgi:hypothetical protein
MTTQATEKRIITQAAKSLIEAGFSIRVYDGAEFVTEKTTDIKTVMAQVFATSGTCFYAFQDNAYVGRVWFIHGNGCDVIADNSLSLDTVLQAAQDLAENC